jgi:hypothetical protein
MYLQATGPEMAIDNAESYTERIWYNRKRRKMFRELCVEEMDDSRCRETLTDVGWA